MSVKLSEETEINIPLKTLVLIMAAIVSASWYVSTTYDRITTLESDLALLTERFESYKTQPGRSSHKMEMLEMQLEHIEKHLEKLENRK